MTYIKECKHRNTQIRAIPGGTKIVCLDCGEILEERYNDSSLVVDMKKNGWKFIEVKKK